MKKYLLTITVLLSIAMSANAQEIIPLDTSLWTIQAKSYVLEKHKGKDAIYLQSGAISPKNLKFLNGTIEYDIYLKEQQSFPGVFFRGVDNYKNGEQFFLRPHLSGKPDANQAAPSTNGLTPWQLYFGPRYSFVYDYKFDDWTHVKLVVNDSKAQVYLNYAEKPNLSWNLFRTPEEGIVYFSGGNPAMHIADIKISKDVAEIVDFNPIERKPIEGLVAEWEVSDMFEEKLLEDPTQLEPVIEARKWQGKIQVEEGTAANISRIQMLYNGNPGNTVFAKVIINSTKDQIKLFHFGYSDRVVAVLNGEAIYRGNNKWRSRDYRYLGTVGLFDAIYLDLKEGKNTLLFAVSEDFGGWLITGKFEDESGIKVKP